MDDHNNFFDCRTNNCSCYKPIDYYDTSNNYDFNDYDFYNYNSSTTSSNSGTTTSDYNFHNFHKPTRDNTTIATCNGSSAIHT